MNLLDLKNKTLGIISSYKDNCGNASYTRQLIEDFKTKFKKVECIELDQRLVHSDFHNLVKANVLKKIHLYDFINVQFEPGLFHRKASKAFKFMEQILKIKNTNIAITFHSLSLSGEYSKIVNFSWLEYLLFKVKFRLKLLNRKDYNPYVLQQCFLLRKIKLNKFNHSNGISIIVHNKKSAEQLAFLGVDSYFHPIVSANNSDIEKFNNDKIRNIILDKHNLSKDKTYIGCYGFYCPYKGVDLILKAMKHLPENFHLVMSSNCHPVSNLKIRNITTEKKNITTENVEHIQYVEQNTYMIYLMDLIIKLNISNRVHFTNHIIDEDGFKELIAAMDVSVFPYYEVGQQGSGPISYATHLNYSGKIILSRTNLFEMYEQDFFPDCFTFFDQGNYLELSQKIKNIKSKKMNLLKARTKFNPNSNTKTYIDALLQNKDVSNFLNQSKVCNVE